MAPLTPRSGNYERLEGGMGPSRSGMRTFAWKKFLIGAGVLIGLVWAFGPREVPQRLNNWRWPPDPTPLEDAVVPTNGGGFATPTKATDVHTGVPVDHSLDDESHPSPPKKLQGGSAAKPRPTSPETDPDPLKTVHCISPYNQNLPLVQYALMIDAGSTGSRIHVYKFNNCRKQAEFEYEVFKMTQPGLSAYVSSPLGAAKSLDVLLDEAVRVVPESLRKCTPVAVKATAGLRLLGTEESGRILDAVKARIKQKYEFELDEHDGVGIMDGRDEGVFAWITANYLLGTIREGSDSSEKPYAVLDLGGASTQIVFEPAFNKPDTSLVEGEHKYDLSFGSKTHVLYQHSYLGYGLMRARVGVHRLVTFMDSIRGSGNGKQDGQIIGNPCLAKGTRRVVEVQEDGGKRKVTMVGEDVGSFDACNRVVQLVMAKDAICEVKPCSFDGVYQPSLMETFPSGKILLLSYFYDRLNPLLSSSASSQPYSKLTVSSLASLASDVCQGKATWLERWGADKALIEELEGRPEWCLDLTFMHGLLRLGYEFGEDREVVLGKQIDGTELGWCLGATIAMVGGELKCRA